MPIPVNSFDETIVGIISKATGQSLEQVRENRKKWITEEKNKFQRKHRKEIHVARDLGGDWGIQVHGKPYSESFEISVVNVKKIDSAQRHFGWFDENKLLISESAGPWGVTKKVFDKLVVVAKEVATELNSEANKGLDGKVKST